MIENWVIYHNPRCSKSREVLDRLRKHGITPRIVEYLKQPPNLEALALLVKQLGQPPETIVRKHEIRFTDLGLDIDPPKSKQAWLKLLVDNPILLERPIVSNGLKAVVGRPPEAVDLLLRG